MYENRPSKRELDKRLKEAKEALKNRLGIFATPSKVVGELHDLSIGDADDVWPLSSVLLEEISIKDYMGSRPPQRSYEKSIEDKELFAFAWWSPKCGKRMYIKFVLKNGRYYYVSLHESRSREQKEKE